MKKTRKTGGGRKKLKPEHEAGKNLKEQMESAVELYEEECLQITLKRNASSATAERLFHF